MRYEQLKDLTLAEFIAKYLCCIAGMKAVEMRHESQFAGFTKADTARRASGGGDAGVIAQRFAMSRSFVERLWQRWQ